MYHEINEAAAKRAHTANSFREFKPGSATASYRAQVDEAVHIAEAQKERVDAFGTTPKSACNSFFEDKPGQELRTEMKQYGFRWSPRNSAWQRVLSSAAEYDAHQILKKFNLEPRDEL